MFHNRNKFPTSLHDKRSKYSYQKPKLPRILIDESSNEIFQKYSNRLTKIAKITLFADTVGFFGGDDKFVYQKANQNKYHVLTGNPKHFKNFIRSKNDVGVIGHASLNSRKVLTNILSFINDSKHKDLFGKFILIGERDTKIKFTK